MGGREVREEEEGKKKRLIKFILLKKYCNKFVLSVYFP